MASTDAEYHILRITIQIKKVMMAVRFPCTLQFQLRNEGHNVDSRLAYELKDGKCQPNEKLVTDIQLLNKQSQYPEKKLSLIVLMASSNGKIPAGSVQLKVAEKGKLVQHSNNQNFAIEKCPDKSAVIEVNMKVQYIRSFHKDNGDVGSTRGKIFSPSSHTLYEKISHRTKTQKIGTPEKFQKGSYEKIFTDSDSPKAIFGRAKNIQEFSHGQASIIQQQLLLNEPETYYQQKILKISKDKDSYAKQVSTLKAEVNSLRRQQQWRNGTSQEQISKYRLQIDSLTQELTTLKDKYKNLERKQRQTANQNRDMKEQLQKTKTKLISTQSSQEQLKRNLYDKDKQLKRLSQQMKQLKQQLDDTKMSLSTQEKKVQYKQTTYKEQINKLTEKFQQSEIQRQKATLQLNNMLTSFESSQKKSQLQVKQKQRAHQDQKNRLTKKIEALTVNVKELKQQNQQLESNLASLKSSYVLLNSQKEEIAIELKDVSSKYESLENVSRKQENNITQLNQQILQLEQHKRQLGLLNKKHIELSAENTKNIETIARFTQKNQFLTKTLKQLEVNLKQTSSTKDSANVRNNDLNKQIQKIKKIQQAKQNEIQSLQENINNLTNKLSESKMKLQQQRMQSQNARNKAQSEILYLIRTKDHLLAEIQQLKWKINRSEESNSSLGQKISGLNERILKLSEELMNQQEVQTGLKENIKQFENKVQYLSGQILLKETKQKELLTINRTKSQTEFQLRKVIKEKQQEIFIMKEKQKQALLHSKEKIEQMESTLKDRQEILDKLSKDFDNSKNQNKELNKNIESYNLKILRSVQQNENIKRELGQTKQTIINLEIDVQTKSKKIEDFEKMAINWSKKQVDLLAKLKSRQETLARTQQEWDKFRADTCTALQQFMIEINKDNITKQPAGQQTKETGKSQTKSVSQTELLAFPDNNMSLLQVQAMKKRQEQLYKIKEQMTRYEEEINLSTIEVNRWKQYSKERQDELEALLLEEKQKVKSLLSEHLTQKNMLIEKVHTYEQKIHELTLEHEKANLEITRVKQQNSVLEQELLSMKEEQEKLEEKTKTLNKTIQTISMSQTQYRSTNETEAYAIAQQNKTQIEKLKNNNKDLEKKIAKQNLTIQEIEQYSRKLQNQMSELQHTKEKLEKKNQFAEVKHQELLEIKKKLESQIYNGEKKLKEQGVETDKIRESLVAEKYKVSDLTIKIGKLNEDVQSLEFDKAQLEKYIEEVTNTMTEIENNARKMQNNHKLTVEKMNETIKQLRQKVITLNSQIDLKSFLISQLENNQSQLKNLSLEQLKQIAQKRSNSLKLQQEIENVKNEIIFTHQNYQNLNREKQSLQAQYKKQKQIIDMMTKQTMEQSVIGELLATKQRQYTRLKEDYDSLEAKLDYHSRDYKQALADMRKQISTKSAREEELKRRIRQMQKQLSHKSYELNNQNQRNREETDRDRLQLIRSVDFLEAQNNRVRSQCEYLRDQLARQSEQLNQQCSELARLLTEKQEMLLAKTDQVKENQKKIKILSNQLKNCLESWQRQKGQLKIKSGQIPQNGQLSKKFQKLIDDIDNRARANQGRK